MNIIERLHFLHRAWRYRLRTERDEIVFLMSRDMRGKTLVDVGAHRGVYSYWMHRCAGPTGHVVAFEPQPELCDYLNDVRSAFSLQRMIVAGLGLSSSSGARNLLRPRDHWGGASLESGMATDADVLPVRVTTLDEYFAETDLRPVRFIKCDVEGHELDVFRGAARILREDRPELLFESTDDRALEGTVFAFLNDAGYEGHFFYRHQLTPVSRFPALRDSLPPVNHNYVFLPREARQPSQVAA